MRQSKNMKDRPIKIRLQLQKTKLTAKQKNVVRRSFYKIRNEMEQALAKAFNDIFLYGSTEVEIKTLVKSEK
jgi:hypothetical protein